MKRIKVLYKVPLRMFKSFLNGVIKSLNVIAILIEVCFPLLLIWMNISLYEAVLLSLVFVFLIHYVKNVSLELNHVDVTGMPIPRMRYTMKDGNMVMMVDETNLAEMLVYMNELEDYIELKGLNKKNE